MWGLGALQTPIAFLFAFGLLVFFHELGHFALAKLSGVKVYEFALGMGKQIASIRKNDTVYSIRLIPVGGFVKFAGMDDAAYNDVPRPSEDFNMKPLLARLAIIAAGPIMNFILAGLLFIGVFVTMGVPAVKVIDILPNSPASRAGIHKGDLILGVNGRSFESVENVVGMISKVRNTSVRLTLRRAGEEHTVTAAPQYDTKAKVSRLGVTLGQTTRRAGIGTALKRGIKYTSTVTKGVLSGLADMVTGRTKAQVSGPIGIFDMVGSTAKMGFVSLLFLIAILSINLGIINLLPIPVLDGGWIAFLLIEGIMRKPLKPEQKGFAQFIGIAFLLFMFLFASYGDVTRLDVIGRLKHSILRWF